MLPPPLEGPKLCPQSPQRFAGPWWGRPAAPHPPQCPLLTCSVGLGWLSAAGHPRGAPMRHGAGGPAAVPPHAVPCRAVPSCAHPAPALPPLGAKCPGEAGLEAGGGGGRSPQRTQHPCQAPLPAPPLPVHCPCRFRAGCGPRGSPRDMGYVCLPRGDTALHPWGRRTLRYGDPPLWWPWSVTPGDLSPSPLGTMTLLPRGPCPSEHSPSPLGTTAPIPWGPQQPPAPQAAPSSPSCGGPSIALAPWGADPARHPRPAGLSWGQRWPLPP